MRSTSNPTALERARREVTATRSRGAAGKITPSDVAERYARPSTSAPTATGTAAAAPGSTRTTETASNRARTEAVRREAAERSADARNQAASDTQGSQAMDQRVRDARAKNTRERNALVAQKNSSAYDQRMDAARRKAGIGGYAGPGDTPGAGNRRVDRSITGAGGVTVVGDNGGTAQSGGYWNDGYGNYGGWNAGGYYYNNCFWNSWGGYYANAWNCWFYPSFYATGLWWNNYWSCGYTWRSACGYRPWRSTFANFYFYGPFLSCGQSVVIYDDPDPNPEVIYIEVPAEEEVVVAAPPAGQAADAQALPADATDPGLQRELNRAAAYYLTQGDRAFRESRFGDAAHFYAKAVEFSPESGILYLVLSDALFATGDYRYAAYALRQALDREPTLATNLVDKRDFYADPADFERQLSTLERYVNDHVLDVDARFVLAANYLFSGNPAGTIGLLDGPFGEELVSSDEGQLLLTVARDVQLGEDGRQD